MKDRGRTLSRLGGLGCLAGLALASAVAPSPVLAQDATGGPPAITRESTGARRTALDAMELKPVPAEALGALSDWQGGAAPASTDLDGNVVLIATWSSWYPAATRVLPMLQRLSAGYTDKGLVVIGAHDKQGWDKAASAAKSAGVTFRFAHDSTNALRTALNVDQDPDFYLVDRAGNLRYADVDTVSLETAVKHLVNETREQAADAPSAVARAADAAKAAARRTGEIRQDFDLAQIPELPFARPSEEDYRKAKWPARWKEYEEQLLNMRNTDPTQEDVRTLLIPTGAEAAWLGNKVPKLQGRVIVAYFWAPAYHFSYDNVQPMMDVLQKKHTRDLVVVGVMTPRLFKRGESNPNTGRNQTEDEVERERKEFQRLVEKTRAEKTYDHYILPDVEGAIVTSIVTDQQTQQGIPVPLAAVFSSDLTMRWIGYPLDPRFDSAVDKVLREDPAVKARKAVEAKWIRENQDKK